MSTCTVNEWEELKKEITPYKEQLQNDKLKIRNNKEDLKPYIGEEYQRDYARVVYSSSFRRLQGKMQLLKIDKDQFFRNRLTHSLEVAQIARSIASNLGYSTEELFVVEAAALAHDIGNPPFGHAGEKKLNEMFNSIGGFEGNAQTLRVLTRLEEKKPAFNGLNLTNRTILSIIKYYNTENNNKEKFIYYNDYKMIEKIIGKDINIRTLDVQIVDLADEISYAAHDLEDGLRVKAFTIDDIIYEFNLKYKNENPMVCNKLLELVEKAKNVASNEYNSEISSLLYKKLFRQELSSSLINTLMSDIGLVSIMDKKTEIGSANDKELGFKNLKDLAAGLKKITFECINHTHEVYYYEECGKLTLEWLKNFYEENVKYLPPEYRVKDLMRRKNYLINNDFLLPENELLNQEEKEKLVQQRLICDYLAGMMDSFAISTYESLSGRAFNNIVADMKNEKIKISVEKGAKC